MTTAFLALLLSTTQGPAIEWHSVSYSPDGKYLLAAKNKMAEIWEGKTGKPLLILEARDYVSTAAFATDGKSFYYGGRDKTLRRVLLPNFDPKAKDPIELKYLYPEAGIVGPERKSWVSKIALSSDGKKIALAVSDQILIVDATTGETLQTIDKADGFGSMHFTKGDTHLLTTPVISGLALYDLTTNPPKEAFKTQTGARGSDGSLSPSGRYFIFGNQKSNAGVADLEKGAMYHTVNVPKDSWVDVHAWAKDAKSYFIGGNQGDVWVVDFALGKILTTFKVDGRVGGFAIHPDGKTIAIAADYVLQYDAATGKKLGR